MAAIAGAGRGVYAPPAVGFSTQPIETGYSFRLTFPDQHREKVDIKRCEDFASVLKRIVSESAAHPSAAMDIYFDCPTQDEEVALRMKSFQESAFGETLQFSIARCANRTIIIHPKPVQVESISEGKVRRAYSCGTIEEFTGCHGVRTLPDGAREVGEFREESRQLIRGYRIDKSGSIEFVHPKALASHKEGRAHKLHICDVEGKLVVLQETHVRKYAITDVPVVEVILKACQKSEGDRTTIRDILLHPSFHEQQNRFIEYVFGMDDSGTPRFFNFSNKTALDVIEAASKTKEFNPLTIVDPVSGRNLFTQAAHSRNSPMLEKLIPLFPKAFLAVGQDVVAELLRQDEQYLARDAAENYEKLGGALDVYHSLWLQVAMKDKPDEEFYRKFGSLSSDQQRVLYDAAFLYCNSFIYETANIPVTPDQYSINLMWINKNRIPNDQEFLFGDGITAEQRASNFQKRFVEPVVKWVKANPDSPVHIWIDGEMASAGAIERSDLALRKALEGTAHGSLRFRNVRETEVVRSNPEAFCQQIPVYFRADLLRTIAADHVLRNRETQFFVYADLDVESLSMTELFDQRTLNFLNDFGFVMAKGGFHGFENSFQILNGDHPQFMDSYRKVLIDLSVEIAVEHPRRIKEQQIYDTYSALLAHFLDADGRYGKLQLDRKAEEDLLDRFRYGNFDFSSGDLPFEKEEVAFRKIMPTKPVRGPRSHFG